MKVYIVTGTTGEYSDRTEWWVCGYFDKIAAEFHATAANDWLRRNNLHFSCPEIARRYDPDNEWPEGPNPYDPDHDLHSYTGSDFSVSSVEMKDEPIKIGFVDPSALRY